MASNSRYILVKQISRGGMAEIYLGRQEGEDGFKRICCIKRILPHYAQDREYIEMFRDEAHICKRLQHANIVRVEGFEEVDESYAIIMEFIDGSDLRKVLVACESINKDLPIPMALYITAEVAKGLHYAHTKIDEITQKPLQIVHRDISPQNILVSFEGEVKFTDFGIADAQSKSNETKPGIVKGKYSYMSPEQITAKPVDNRTDIFALAIVFWEMIAMERLFHGENDVITIQRVKNCELKLFPKRRNGERIDPELQDIVLKGLEKDPKKRYQSAQDLELACRKYLGKKYPDFSSTELSEFIKTILSKQRAQSKENIKKALTAPSLNGKAKQEDQAEEKKEDLNLAIDSDANQEFSIAVPRGGGGGVGSGSIRVAGNNNPAVRPVGTGLNRGPVGQNTGMRSLPVGGGEVIGPVRTEKLSVMTVMGLAILASLIVISAYRWMQPSNYSQLVIMTEPKTVMIRLNGRLLPNKRRGKYHRTKVKINVPRGQHELVISRDGFETQTVTINAKGGSTVDQTRVVLEREKNLSSAAVKVEIDKDAIAKKMWVEINGGLESGWIPTAYTDLIVSESYRMIIYPSGPRQKEGRFACNFTPNSSNWRAPYIVSVDPNLKKCTTP